MERLFKLNTFGKCEKFANYREKFSFARKVVVPKRRNSVTENGNSVDGKLKYGKW